MSRSIKKGAENQSIELYIIDDTDGTPVLGVVFDEDGMDLRYRREGAAVVSVTEVTLAALTTAYASGGFLEIGNGWYRFDVPNAAFATGADSVLVFGTVTDMIVMGVATPLVDYDPTDGVRLGLTALPNAAADGVGGLPISDAGGLDLDTILDVAISTRSDFNEANDPVELLDSGGSAGTSAEELVDDVWDEILTGGTHNINTSSGKRLRQIQEAGSYSFGLAWLDTINGVAGSTSFENGVEINPTDTIASINTILASIPLHGVHVASGSSVTFAASQQNQEWTGANWTLAFGGQSIAGSSFEGATISGISTGVPGTTISCVIGAASYAGGDFVDCALTDTLTLTGATSYTFFSCHDDGGAIIDYGAAVGNTTVHNHHYGGDLQINNLGATGTDVLNFTSSGGKLTLDSSCVGGTVNISGTAELVNNGSGITINDTGSIIGVVGVPVGADISADIADIPNTVWDELLTGATHNVPTSAGRIIREGSALGYEGGFIYINTILGTAGTTLFENGIIGTPVDDMPDANTINASLVLEQFAVLDGSSLTFTASQEAQFFTGHGWSLAFGGQSISGSCIHGAVLSGIATGANLPRFVHCEIGTVTIPPVMARECGITGPITVGSAGIYTFDRCHSMIAGLSAFIFDFAAAVGDTDLNWRNGSGGIDLRNMGQTGTDVASLEGRGQFIIGADCDPANCTIVVRGHFKFTDNVAGGFVAGGGTLEVDANSTLTNISDSVWTYTTRTLTAFSTALAVSVWNVLFSDISIADTLGLRLKQLSNLTVRGTVDDATFTPTTTEFETDLSNTTTDHYKSRLATFDAETLDEQQTSISASVLSNGKVKLTVVALTSAPADGVTFEVT